MSDIEKASSAHFGEAESEIFEIYKDRFDDKSKMNKYAVLYFKSKMMKESGGSDHDMN